MDSTGRSNVGMQMDADGNMSFPSLSSMANSSSDEALMISKASIAAHPLFSAGRDSLSLLDHRTSLGSRIEPFGSDHQPVGNQAIRGSISSLLPGQPETDPRLAYFGSGNLSEAVIGSFTMPEFMGISDSGCLPSFSSYVNDNGGYGMNLGEDARTRGCQDSEDGVGMNSPNNWRTRKRNLDSRSLCGPNKSNDTSKLQDALNAQVEKKQKHESDEYPNIPKQNTRQSKDNSRGEEVPKENYIHVRARRGQATNSHSLAERIRREKISERMKMLQELVPGCSKITGKAVMLDEIINYVQSLQQQVEDFVVRIPSDCLMISPLEMIRITEALNMLSFLSMKLATLIPDLSFDAGKTLPMDMNSHHAGATTMGLSIPRLGSFQHFPTGMSKGTLPISPSTAQYLSLSQLPFNSELLALSQVGFDSNSTDILKPEGHPKPEQ